MERIVYKKPKGSPNKVIKQIKRDRLLYLMILPVIIWYIIFAYLPMGGISLAFKYYRFDTGLWKSPWIGLDHFKHLFIDPEFWRAFKNTVIFGIGKLALHFPMSIIIAILLNEIVSIKAKKLFQTILTFPHFISWVVLSGILINLFASNGSINQILGSMGFNQVSPLLTTTSFRWFIWLSNMWKEIGWDAIIFMAALASVDLELYEAASIDGAGRFQKMIHITWPGIKGTVCIMLILQVGSILGAASFDQIFNLYSSPVYAVADTIDTYVYRSSFQIGANFGYSTAVGLFKSLIGIVLITVANKCVTSLGEQGLY